MKIIKRYILIEHLQYDLMRALDNHHYNEAKTLIKRIKKMSNIMLSIKELLILIMCGVVAGITIGMGISKYFIYG